MADSASGAKTLERGLGLLDHVPNGLTRLDDIATAAGLSRSSTHRMLTTPVSTGSSVSAAITSTNWGSNCSNSAAMRRRPSTSPARYRRCWNRSRHAHSMPPTSASWWAPTSCTWHRPAGTAESRGCQAPASECARRTPRWARSCCRPCRKAKRRSGSTPPPYSPRIPLAAWRISSPTCPAPANGVTHSRTKSTNSESIVRNRNPGQHGPYHRGDLGVGTQRSHAWGAVRRNG